LRVIAPAGVLTADSTYTPKVMVRNFGLSTISFPVLLTVGTFYQDSASASNLAPGDSAVVQFLPWTTPGQGAFRVQCATALAGDEFPDNDLIAETARVYFRDIALVAFASPPDTVDSGQAVWPQARVRNNGTQDETFLMYFRISDEGYDHWSMARALPTGRETVLTFTPWTPKTPGDHYYVGQLVAGDMDPSNDNLDGDVFVRAGSGILEAIDGERETTNERATIVRGLLNLQSATCNLQSEVVLLDPAGRRASSLVAGPNDVSRLPPGVYFVREAHAQAQAQATRKVVVTH
jgi:hypothetical protein